MRLRFAIAVALALFVFPGVVAPPSHAEVSFEAFYSDLSPHGSWLVSARFGQVWQPRDYTVGWNPYYDGHWEYTDLGWTWVSDYGWGAIPYHYGTWVLDPEFGWVWVPGTAWAPAWVVFRTGPDYIGWAPVAPEFAIGMSFGAAAPLSGSFLFVSTRDFAAPRIRSCVVPESRARLIFDQTRVASNLVIEHDVVVNRGPDLRVVERASGHAIREVPIERLARVSPFAHVRRDLLTVHPGGAEHVVRAAEPVSAKHPRPPSSERAATPQLPPRGPREVPQQERRAVPPPAPKLEPRNAPPHDAPAPAPRVERVDPPTHTTPRATTLSGLRAKPDRHVAKPKGDKKKDSER